MKSACKSLKLKQLSLVSLALGMALFSAFVPASYAETNCDAIQVTGHRGESSSDRTENTYRSLDFAAANGADGVEFDIRLSKDRQWVLMHDASVRRTTNGRGYVSKRYASTITGRYLTDDSRVVGMRLHAPLLSTVMNGTDLQQGLAQKYPGLRYQIEFKPSSRATVNDVAAALNIITATAPESQLVVTSTSTSMLEKVHAARPSITRAYISLTSPVSPAILPTLQTLGIQYANVGYNSIDNDFVNQAHSLGLSVTVRGPADPTQWLYALSLNPDNLVVDQPSKFVAWCKDYISNPPSPLRVAKPSLSVSRSYVQPD